MPTFASCFACSLVACGVVVPPRHLCNLLSTSHSARHLVYTLSTSRISFPLSFLCCVRVCYPKYSAVGIEKKMREHLIHKTSGNDLDCDTLTKLALLLINAHSLPNLPKRPCSNQTECKTWMRSRQPPHCAAALKENPAWQSLDLMHSQTPCVFVKLLLEF
jgi:hypothetical protein